MNQLRQGVGVRRLELGERAVLDDLGGQLVAEGELLQDIGIGGIARLGLLDGRQLELLEEHLRQLLGRADVELAARQRVDLARETDEGAVELLGEFLEPRGVDPDAVALHHGEHGYQRPLEVLVERGEPDLLERARQHVPELPHPAGARPGRGEPRPFPQQVGAHLVELVARAGGVEQISADGGVLEGREAPPAGEPPLDRRLDVVADETPPAEVGGSRAQRQDGRPRRRMKDAEGAEGRLGRRGFPHPVDGHRLISGDRAEPALERLGPLQGRERLGGNGGRRRGGKLADERVELELAPEGPQPLPVGLLATEVLETVRDGHPRAHGGELAREKRLRAIRGQRLAELAGHEREVLVEPRHASELADELDGRLLAEARHTGNVVDAVAHQRQEIGDLFGRHPPLGGHRRLVVPDGLAPGIGREHPHARAHELEHVLVARDEDHLDRLALHPLHQRAQHIVGLEAGHFQKGQPERFEDAHHQGDLAAQVVRHPGARLLVGRELRLAEGRPRGIPGHRGVVRALVAEELPEHGGHAEDGVGGLALRVREIGQRVVGAVEIPGAVHDEQARAHTT